MPQPHVNGHAVDLAAVKAAAEQRQALEAQREQLTNQLLAQSGLLCACGERIRDGVVYFLIVEGPVQTAQGPQVGLNLIGHTFHSRECPHAILAETQAIARRPASGGPVVWLDERRAAKAASAQGK